MTQASFMRDVKNHKMTILKNDNLYRHIRFRAPGTNCQYFDLITFPGSLLIRGDMGCWLFERCEDMFYFFLHGQTLESKSIGINPSYWGEKLECVDNRTHHPGTKEFDTDTFFESLKEQFNEWYGNKRYDFPGYKKSDIWDDIVDWFGGCDFEEDYYRYASNYQWNGHDVFDLESLQMRKYRSSYIWCLYAIVWGIKKFHIEMIKQDHAEAEALKRFYEGNR